MEHFDCYFFYCNLKRLKLERKKENSKGLLRRPNVFQDLAQPALSTISIWPSASLGLSKQSWELLQPLQTFCLHHFHMHQYLLLWNAPEVPHTKLVCLTQVLLAENTNGWALWGIPTEWEAWRLKSLKNTKALIITVAIVFVHKLWRYSDFSCRSILLFQEENIFLLISVHKQVPSAGGISIFHP